jgi:hypothetical protein
METDVTEGMKVLSRGEAMTGEATGHTRPCTLHGCRGARLQVRWPDQRITYPCTKGMERVPDGWKIL